MNTEYIPARAYLAARLFPSIFQPDSHIDGKLVTAPQAATCALEVADILLSPKEGVNYSSISISNQEPPNPLIPQIFLAPAVEQRLADLEAVVFGKGELPEAVKDLAEDAPHNPNNVRPEQIPPGYRVATKREIADRSFETPLCRNPHTGELEVLDSSRDLKYFTIIVRKMPLAKELQIDWAEVNMAYGHAYNAASYFEHLTPERNIVALKAAYAEILRQQGGQP